MVYFFAKVYVLNQCHGWYSEVSHLSGTWMQPSPQRLHLRTAPQLLTDVHSNTDKGCRGVTWKVAVVSSRVWSPIRPTPHTPWTSNPCCMQGPVSAVPSQGHHHRFLRPVPAAPGARLQSVWALYSSPGGLERSPQGESAATAQVCWNLPSRLRRGQAHLA